MPYGIVRKLTHEHWIASHFFFLSHVHIPFYKAAYSTVSLFPIYSSLVKNYRSKRKRKEVVPCMPVWMMSLHW